MESTKATLQAGNQGNKYILPSNLPPVPLTGQTQVEARGCLSPLMLSTQVTLPVHRAEWRSVRIYLEGQTADTQLYYHCLPGQEVT